jgi:hypothetical protein
MPISDQQHRQALLDEYRVWARICEDKHGLPWPILESQLQTATDQEILAESKKLKMLGRTPHEG